MNSARCKDGGDRWERCRQDVLPQRVHPARFGGSLVGTRAGTVGTETLSPSDRLRLIASRIRALATSGRTDPETILVEKHELAAEVAAIAAEVDRA